MTQINHKLLDRVMGLTPSEKPICKCGHRDYNHANERNGPCQYWNSDGTRCKCMKFKRQPKQEMSQ